MFASIARALFGNANDRALKAYQRRVPQINAHESAMQALSDDALRGKTAEFRERLAQGATLHDLLRRSTDTTAASDFDLRRLGVDELSGLLGRVSQKENVSTLARYFYF